jgi:small-conductance mechanosensitive channel
MESETVHRLHDYIRQQERHIKELERKLEEHREDYNRLWDENIRLKEESKHAD